MTRRRRLILRGWMWASVVATVLASTALVIGHRYEFGWGWYPVPRGAIAYPRYAVVQVFFGSVWVAGGSALQLGSRRFQQGFFFRHTLFPRWRGDWTYGAVQGDYHVGVPLWVLTALGVSSAVGSFALSRGPRPGLCPRCGYDLSGVPAGVCPECGKSPGS